MLVTDARGKAQALYDARRTRAPISSFTAAEPSLETADGYAVQKELVGLLLADGDSIVGYKAGPTSEPMRRMFGVDGPDYGPVLASTLYRDGDTVPLRQFISPRVAGEIGFVLDAQLVGPGVTPARARAAIGGAVAGIEIIDSRIADRPIQLADTVADPASHAAAAVSSRIVELGDTDTRLIGMTLTRNGELIDTGAGAAASGDPLTVVAWLANVLGENGIVVEAGHVVMTGALHAAVPMSQGDAFRAEFDRLGPVTLAVAE